jgi:hypothetical protein
VTNTTARPSEIKQYLNPLGFDFFLKLFQVTRIDYAVLITILNLSKLIRIKRQREWIDNHGKEEFTIGANVVVRIKKEWLIRQESRLSQRREKISTTNNQILVVEARESYVPCCPFQGSLEVSPST